MRRDREYTGRESVVIIDDQRGLVMKLCASEEAFGRELWAYEKLKEKPWVPRVLGTVAEREILFLSLEGREVSDEEWETDHVQRFLRKCIREMHQLGLHHHDLAPRNITIRDNQLFIIDFEMSVTSQECNGAPHCPDVLTLRH